MRDNNEQNIKSVIKSLFKTYHIDNKVHELHIKEIWLSVMGKTIAHYTNDIKLKDGHLTLYLTSAPLKQDLSFQKEIIKSRLNEEFGEPVIQEISIR